MMSRLQHASGNAHARRQRFPDQVRKHAAQQCKAINDRNARAGLNQRTGGPGLRDLNREVAAQSHLVKQRFQQGPDGAAAVEGNERMVLKLLD